MDSWHRLTAQSSALIERTGIPRSVLSRLLSCGAVGVGCRLLDVGCGAGELVEFLDSLGVECTGMDESPRTVSEARHRVPQCEFHCAFLSGGALAVPNEFDVILVRSSSAYRGPILSRAALTATSQLLTRVRPGGCIAFLARFEAGKPASPGHLFSCYSRHVASLPGEHELHEIAEGTLFTRPIRSLMARRGSAHHGIALFRLPLERFTSAEWSDAVAAVWRADPAPCCEWSIESSAKTDVRSRAA